MTTFFFVVTHSFFHCLGRAVKCQVRRPFGCFKEEIQIQRLIYKPFTGSIHYLVNKSLKNVLKCSTQALYTNKRDFFYAPLQINMSPLHKLQQTVVNKISFIIEWVYWIQLLHSCTCENHEGSDTRCCSCGIYFRRRQSWQKYKNCVKSFVWLAARLQNISSSLKCPARKQLRENMPYPNDMRFPTRIVTQTN